MTIMKKILLIGACAAMLGASEAAASGTIDLQGKTFAVDTIAHYYIGPGLTHTHLQVTGNGRTFQAYAVTMDRNAAKGLRVKVDVGNDSCLNAERITSIAKRKTTDTRQYLAGINGDFFITSGFTAQHPLGNAILGYPNMSCATDGKLVAPDIIDIGSRENAMIVDRDGYMYIDATDLKYRLLAADGVTPVVDATAVNYPRNSVDLVVYNSYNGTHTHTSADGRELTLVPAPGQQWAINKPMKFVVQGAWRNAGNSAIPADGIVISVGPSCGDQGMDVLNPLKDGDELCLKIECSLPAFGAITPDISEICGGDVRILREDVVTTEAIRWINTPSALYSRALCGYSRDRNLMVLCAVDAGAVNSSGISYYEGADLMRYLGCYDALDLDGGGSTTMWTHSHGIVNNLRDGSERAVGNGLFFVLDAPKDDALASLRFASHAVTMPRYGLFRPVVYGYNKYGQLIDTDVQGFTLSAPPELGTVIAGQGALLASGQGTHALTATLNGLTATMPVTIDANGISEPRLSDVLIDNIHPWTVELQAKVAGHEMEVSPLAYAWESSDPAVATVTDNGVVTGVADGTAVITGALDGKEVTVNVTVQCPKAAVDDVLADDVLSGWTVAGTGVAKGGTVTASADEGAMMDVNFTVSSTRGNNMKVSRDIMLYSRPNALTMSFDTHGVAVKEVSFDVQSGSARAVNRKATPAQDADGIYSATLDLANVADVTAAESYPMTLKALTFTPTKPARGTFRYTLRSLTAEYHDYSAGVQDVVADSNSAERLTVSIISGQLVIPFEAESLELYDLSGRLVDSARHTFCLPAPAVPGVYILRAGTAAAKLTL